MPKVIKVPQKIDLLLELNKPAPPPADEGVLSCEEDYPTTGTGTGTPAARTRSLVEAIRESRVAPHAAGPPHVIIKARAGTGKTTTMVEGLREMVGQRSELTPSPQQRQVWDQIMMSRGVRYITVVAYNTAIAEELQRRVPFPVKAMTTHKMGLLAVLKLFKYCLDGDHAVNKNRVDLIVEELLGRDLHEVRKNSPVLLASTKRLVELCKCNLVHPGKSGIWETACDALVREYDLDLDGQETEVYDLTARVLVRCLDVDRDRCIDYDDMVWLPVMLNLPIFKSDLLMVDEAQDLNKARMAIVRMAGRRIMLCGDDRQAIYGFAGASSGAMTTMLNELRATPAGCVEVPLTVTRRCGKAIVAEARRIVPDFEAHEDNHQGEVRRSFLERRSPSQRCYRDEVEDGDLVLCRNNAPLVGQCLKFMRAGRKAYILGKKDVAESIISLIRKLERKSTVQPYVSSALVQDLQRWRDAEVAMETAKKTPSDSKIEAVNDKYSCIVALMEGADTSDTLVRKLETMFTDNPNLRGIILSSIHRSKGKESRRVFILQPKGATVPNPRARPGWEADQERNLHYVAVTRAIETLVYVDDPDDNVF